MEIEIFLRVRKKEKPAKRKKGKKERDNGCLDISGENLRRKKSAVIAIRGLVE